MMLGGADLDRLHTAAFVFFVYPLTVVPFFNFGPRMQLNLIHSPSSRWVITSLFLAALLTILLWIRELVPAAYAVVFSSLWSQVLLLRLLARRYFRLSGIYPGQVAFWFWGAENNLRLSRRNRNYALLLLVVAIVELGLLGSTL